MFCCGKSGMGKTSWALDFIRACPHDRICIYDHQNEFAFRLGIPPEQVATDPESFIRLAQTNRVIPYDFTLKSPGFKREEFALFCDLVFDMAEVLDAKGMETLFVCDELQQFVTGTQIESAPEEFRQILETGRRRGLDSLSLSRAPNRVNVAIREEFTEMIVFRLNDEQSLKFARDIGMDVAAVSRLEPHHYLYYNVISGREAAVKLEFSKRGKVSV